MAIATPTEYGGYEYSFVNDPPDRCICKICHLPSRDAYMTGPCCQGLTICKSCLTNWKKIAGDKKCPVCRKNRGGFSKNYPIRREINSLYIYCTNKMEGCEWQGELNNINNHLDHNDGCLFQKVKCFNECGKMIQRQYLIGHVIMCPRRIVYCQYCHHAGEHQFIEGLHKGECLKLPQPCPNKCGVGWVPRKDMVAHRKECPLEMIQCEYYSVGCEQIKLARKDMEKHNKENTEKHLIMTNRVLAVTKVQVTELEVAQAKLVKANDKLAKTNDKLAEANDNLAEANDKLTKTNNKLATKLTAAKNQNANLRATNDQLARESERAQFKFLPVLNETRAPSCKPTNWNKNSSKLLISITCICVLTIIIHLVIKNWNMSVCM